ASGAEIDDGVPARHEAVVVRKHPVACEGAADRPAAGTELRDARHSRRHGGTIDEAQTARHRTSPAVLPFIVTRFLSPSGIVAVYPRVCVCRRAGCRDCDSGLMPMKHVKLGGFRQPEPRMSSK